MAPTYVIHSAPIQEIQLRFGKLLNKTPPAVIIQEESGEENTEKEISEEEDMHIASENTQVLGTQDSQSSAQTQLNKNSPYPERLLIENPVVRLQFDLENELKNVCIKIPLLQAIRDVPIYSKMVSELCLKKPGRKQKDPPTIHVIGQLSNYISDYPLPPKFANPGNPVVTICINEIPIGNTLVDLGAAINVMCL